MAVSIPATLLQKWPLFIKFGLAKGCTFQSVLESEYAEGNVVTPIDSSHNINVIFKNIKQFLIDGSTIRSIDRVALFPVLELPVIPKINDVIVDPSLTEWKVQEVVGDPADAHYELRVRPIK